jgi:hypothetical protein
MDMGFVVSPDASPAVFMRIVQPYSLTDNTTEAATNAWRTNDRVSCANHVTWTGQHAMTLREKTLIFMAFREVATSARNRVILQMRNPLTHWRCGFFYLVAGVGFEPTTFRL